jgi:hypothetical protein
MLACIAASSCDCANLIGGPSPQVPPPDIAGDPLTAALPSEARRLSQAEVDATLRDVLQDASAPAARLLLTDTFTPYDNDLTQQESSAALVDALEALSVDVVERALASDAARAVIFSCAPAAPDDAGCFREIAAAMGKRLLRRPLGAEELDAYAGFLSFTSEQSPFFQTGFDTAVELLLRALLMDPEFLFRIEIGAPAGETGVARLNPFETATRMSYLLWGSAPDDALLAEAEAGRLEDAAARRAMAEQMLADPRARDQLARFHAMWLGYRAIPTPPDLAARFSRETSALLSRVVLEERRDYLDVFRLEETFLDDALADHYGLPRPDTSPEPGWVPYGESGRAGILSQGALLASFSKFTDTSPTQRGILVRNRLMCLPIDPPPVNVNADEPPPETPEANCKVERYSQHTQVESCSACHSQMDPIGFGLENYDIAGRFRTHDDGKEECIIDGIGELPGYGFFSGPKELAHRLVDENLIAPCFMQQLSAFSWGRQLTDEDLLVAAAWTERFEQSGRRLDELLLEQIAGEQFVTRRDPGVQ